LGFIILKNRDRSGGVQFLLCIDGAEFYDLAPRAAFQKILVLHLTPTRNQQNRE
jgi:hypothetical protein